MSVAGDEVRAPSSGSAVGRGFLWLLAGHATYMLCQWGMLVVLARLGSPEKVGQFALALATSAPLVLFTNLGLRRVLVTDARAEFRFADYLGLRILTGGAAVGMIGLVAFSAGFSRETAAIVAAMGVAKAVEAVVDIVHGLFQKRDRPHLIAASCALRGLLSLAGLAVALRATGEVLGAVLGMAAGWLAAFLLFDRPRAARLLRDPDAPRARAAPDLPSPRRARWLPLLRLSFPLGVVALLASLRSSIPTLVIAKEMGEGAVGIFTALALFHAASNRVVYQLGEAGTGPLARRYADGGEGRFVGLLAGMLLVGLAISAGGLAVALLAGREILALFFGAPYAAESAVLVGLMAAAGAANLQTILDCGMTAARRFRIQPAIYGASGALLLLLCAVLVPSRGLQGAVLAIGAVSALEAVLGAVVVGRAVGAGGVPRPHAALEGP